MSRTPGEEAQRQARQQPGRRDRARAEQITLAISALIVLVLVGLVLYQYVADGTQPAVIEVRPRLDQVREADGLYYVPVQIANSGDSTAEDVRVRVSLATDAPQSEPSELRVQFLAGGATANGTVAFRTDPSRTGVTVSVISYLEP